MTQHVYAEGQIWSYRTRPNEDGSRVIIRAIEALPGLGEVFHVSITDLKLRNHRVEGGLQRSLPHIPVDRAALDASVLEIDGIAAEDTEWRAGYDVWTQAFVNGDAGVFDLPVAEILGYVETIVAAAGEQPEA
ncbi:hypothetical protein EC912_102225 [Luteibacter rhizovicinus]|uniref:Uncharacterized protein n=1 Tax=Luteibacter rhizovicinus TaxID=242606 RepID=A0A4R3YTP6_9GAMM|nr:hypothetical protein [Luteibacter rhizovicinus]TCV95880.1 hypothetical protein EC912_102225 [Luteibacter rhizovicinus]